MKSLALICSILFTLTCEAQYVNPFNPGSLEQEAPEQEGNSKIDQEESRCAI